MADSRARQRERTCKAEGHVWHRVYEGPGFTLGTAGGLLPLRRSVGVDECERCHHRAHWSFSLVQSWEVLGRAPSGGDVRDLRWLVSGLGSGSASAQQAATPWVIESRDRPG